MKSIRRILAIGVGLILSFNPLYAQPAVFSHINVGLAGAVQTEPLSLKITDVKTFHSLTDAQLAALLKILAATPTIAVEKLPRSATYVSLQNPDWPPLPTAKTPAWSFGEFFLLSDLNFSYEDAAKKSASGGQMRALSPSGFEGEGFGIR